MGLLPKPKKRYQHLSSLPGLGAIATYLGERGALIRSAGQGVDWLTERTADHDPARSASENREAQAERTLES